MKFFLGLKNYIVTIKIVTKVVNENIKLDVVAKKEANFPKTAEKMLLLVVSKSFSSPMK